MQTLWEVRKDRSESIVELYVCKLQVGWNRDSDLKSDHNHLSLKSSLGLSLSVTRVHDDTVRRPRITRDKNDCRSPPSSLEKRINGLDEKLGCTCN